MVTFKLDGTMLQRLREMSKFLGVSVSEVVRLAVKHLLRRVNGNGLPALGKQHDGQELAPSRWLGLRYFMVALDEEQADCIRSYLRGEIGHVRVRSRCGKASKTNSREERVAVDVVVTSPDYMHVVHAARISSTMMFRGAKHTLTVRMPEQVVRLLDELVKRGLFPSRGEALRTAVRLFLDEYGVSPTDGPECERVLARRQRPSPRRRERLRPIVSAVLAKACDGSGAPWCEGWRERVDEVVDLALTLGVAAREGAVRNFVAAYLAVKGAPKEWADSVVASSQSGRRLWEVKLRCLLHGSHPGW